MKILWITLESILPTNTGGRIGVFKRLEQIAKNNEIYLYYPYDDDIDLTQVKELKKYCVEVHPYSRKQNRLHGVLNLWKYPYTVGSRDFPRMKADILQCIQQNDIQIINVDFPHMCVNLLGSNIRIPIVLNEHNIEWKVYETISKSQNNILKKIAYRIDSFRLKSYERILFNRLHFSKVTFVSSDDLKYMVSNNYVKSVNAELIPVGAEITKYAEVPHEGKIIAYVGKMSYGPNIEAVRWFVHEILPLIRKQVSNVKFYIIGKDPSEEVRSLFSDDVVVTGTVDSVKEYYAMADLIVLPLLNGGGVKVKLLEAISYRKKVVSTSTGVEGTLFANSSVIPIYDDAQNFADSCVDFLNGNGNTDAAYNIFINHYTWKSVGEKYNRMFCDVLNNH